MSVRWSRIPHVLVVAMVALLMSGPARTFSAGAGRIYVTEDTQILQWDDMTGKGRITLGKGGTGVNQFNGPSGIFVDGSNRIYVADYGNNRIIRMNGITGAGWTTQGSKGGGANQLNAPVGIFVDRSGRIYVADSGNYRVTRVNDMTGAGWTALTTPGITRAIFVR